MFGINGGEFLVILLVAVIVIGPARLPKYAEQLARLTKQARHFVQDARSRVDEELGEDVKDIDWAALDPRRYDPRRIVRDALLDPDPVRPATAGVAAAAATATTAGPAPFDDEAT
ncbi:Sec-independent protein translocase TatB [Cellulomonas sp. NPDC089187]|uniref:Sec-independent protein translocase TatB n=1 Tax=Cellulomonas sp. NPDC089187 TaxID=3154970 RepID=UPI00342ECCE1